MGWIQQSEVDELGLPVPTQIVSNPGSGCRDVAGVKEELVYQFDVEYRYFGPDPRSGQYFCLDHTEQVVSCCGFIEY